MSDNERMNISDEAAKIAGDAFMETLTDLRLKEGGGFKVVSQQRRAIRAALEAAAPHLMPTRNQLADILKGTGLPAGESYEAADAILAASAGE